MRIARDRKVIFTWPVIGQLRKGDKKTEGKPGIDLEVLRFVGSKPEYQEAFVRLFGSDKIGALHVYLAYADPEVAYFEACEKWARSKDGVSKLMHRCDSKVMVKWWDPAKMEYSFEQKPCEGGCKPVGRLRLVIPELYDAGVAGDVMLSTTSWNDTATLSGAVEMVAQEAKTRGIPMNQVPLVLRRAKRAVSHKMADGKVVSMQKSLLEIALADTFLAQRKAQPVTVVEETGEIVESGADAEVEDIMPEWAEDEQAQAEPTKSALPAANGGPGWPSIPAWKERFEAVCAQYKVSIFETKQIIGSGKFGEMPYKDAEELVIDFAEHRAAQAKLV